MIIQFVTRPSQQEVVELLCFRGSYPEVKLTFNVLGAVTGAVASEQRLAEMLDRVPRLSAQWTEVERA